MRKPVPIPLTKNNPYRFADSQTAAYQESAFLTSVVNTPLYLADLTKIIPDEEVFSQPLTQAIWKVVYSMYQQQRGMDIRPVTVLLELRKMGFLADLKEQGITLKDHPGVVMDLASMINYAEEIVKCHKLRYVQQKKLEIENILLSYGDTTDASKILIEAYEETIKTGYTKYHKSAKEAGDEAISQIERAIAFREDGKISGVPTGFPKIDRHNGGWQDDAMILIAARPGQGKTALAVHCSLAAAEQGYPVGFISIEMPASSIITRMIANKTEISVGKIRRGHLTPEDLQKIKDAKEYIESLPIYFYDDPSSKEIKIIEPVIKEWKRKYGIRVLFVDYAQYLTPKDGKFFNETEKVTKVSQELKTLQRELKIPIVALAQMSRDSEKSTDPRPQLVNLKQSGQLEQDASEVFMIFNPHYYNDKGIQVFDEASPGGSAEFPPYRICLYLRKARDGELCRFDVFGDLSTSRFSDNDIFSTPDPTPQQTIAFTSGAIFNNINALDNFDIRRDDDGEQTELF